MSDDEKRTGGARREPGPAEAKLFTGTCFSEPGRPGMARWMASPRFYARVIFVVTRAAIEARQGRLDSQRWVVASEGIMRALMSVGAGVEVSGLEHLEGLEGPVVFVSNHMSTLETFGFPSMIEPRIRHTYIVKRSLVEYPVFSYVMRSRDPVVVGRENARDDLKTVMTEGVKRLGSGVSIVVFPQTTRTETFDEASFNSIGVKLARKAGVDVVPVAVKTNVWSNGKRFKDFGPIRPRESACFAFGPRLTVEGNGKETQNRVIAFIKENLARWSAVEGT